LSETNNWDFGLRYLSSNTNFSAYFEFLNKWAVNTSVSYTSQSLDARILRGGGAMRLPSVWYENIYGRTDPSKKFCFELATELSMSDNSSALYYSVQPGIKYTPLNTLKLSASFNYSGNRNNLQYISTTCSGNDPRYILGTLEQHTMGITFRVDYNITPELSIQYYGSPFVAVGKYSEFKRVTDAKAAAYQNRFSLLDPTLDSNNMYEVSENNNAVINYSFRNPDFNFSQFRSNFVFRWEYRPGSQIYLVWSQDRTAFAQPGSPALQDGISDLKGIFPNNIFLIKFNRWFSI
jgi:hypothetical protein